MLCKNGNVNKLLLLLLLLYYRMRDLKLAAQRSASGYRQGKKKPRADYEPRSARGRAVKRNKKIIDLKTALLNEAGLERNRFYFCLCVVPNARAIYRLSVSVSDYILCIAWVKRENLSEEYKFTYVQR